MLLSVTLCIGEWSMFGTRQELTNVTSVMLLQQVFYSVMYWSYVPLASLGVLAGVFAVKIPLEVRFCGLVI